MQNCIVAKKGYKWQKLFTELKRSSTVSRKKWAFGLTKFFKGADMTKLKHINFDDVFEPLVLDGSKTFSCRFSEKEEDFSIGEIAFKAVKINEYPLRIFLHYINDGRYNPSSFGFESIIKMFNFYYERSKTKGLSCQHIVYVYQLSRKYETHGLF